MPPYDLTRLSMNELMELFYIRKEIVELAERTNSDQRVIDENKKELRDIKEALAIKRENPFIKNRY
jgi:hypothetical protein